MNRLSQWVIGVVVVAPMAVTVPAAVPSREEAPPVRTAVVGDGVELHYVERGKGVPVVFVHGSLSDYSYWHNEVDWFARDHRAITYSRRYNSPNTNKPCPGYSAVADADDLAAFIKKLDLGRVHVVGHSYGALTGLFLAVKHPELVRTLVLAEPPAVSLLDHLPGDQAATGKATLADIRQRMVKPMKVAFGKGDRAAGIRAFLAYVLGDPQAWDRMSESSRKDALQNAGEWDVMMTTGELFPAIDPKAIRQLDVPVLLLSGEKSYPFLNLIDEELDRLLPEGRHRRVVLRGATHRMWFEQPEACRKAVVEFWRGK
jgi:pimeloyl-ACP methyl ester carboxylesterase